MSSSRPAQRRGAALAGTLTVILIAVVATFSLCAVSLSHLTLATRFSNTQRARNAADSVVSLAVARLLGNPLLGQTQSSSDDVELTTADGAVAYVTFSPTTASRLGIPVSTNNLGREAAVPGWNRTVPQNGLQIVGSCTVDGASGGVERVMYIPPFPYAIASSGPVRSDQGLVVARVNGPVDAATFDQIPLDRLMPASLVSNSVKTEALSLGTDSRVTGDAQAVGGIVLGQHTSVLGQVRAHADSVKIPRITVEDQLAELQDRMGVQTLASGALHDAITGFARREGDLEISGDMALDGGVVYVQGNLTVHGGIKGKGAVYVTGKTDIVGASLMATDNLTALVSLGDVSLNGGDKGQSSYKGLIYTEGNFTARDITLIGAFVANGQTSDSNLQGSKMSLRNVNLLQQQEATDLKITVAAPAPSPMALENFGYPFTLDRTNGALTWYDDSHGESMPSTMFEVRVLMNGTYPNLTATFPDGTTVPMAQAQAQLQSYVQSQITGTFDPSTWNRATSPVLQYIDPDSYRPGARGGGGSGSGGNTITLDLSFNRFVSPADSIRLMMWRQL